MTILQEVVGAVSTCFWCCLPGHPSGNSGLSRNLKRLSDWRAHPTLSQYDLEKHIADGGFSEIWLASDRSTGDKQCIKVVNLRKPGLLPIDVEILRGEARFLRLLDHPGLLRCCDVFETKYHMVMILEYLSGGQILDHLHKVEHYSEAQAGRLFAQVVGAVAYMHNLNIVHRDIKPENVIFCRPVDECVSAGRPLRVKVIDLGMATVLLPPEAAGSHTPVRRTWLRRSPVPQRRDPPCSCMGSPGFIAPEVVHGRLHTLAMDVYSLGVLLFAMLTGRKHWSLRDCRNLSYADRSISDAPGLKDPVFLSLSPSARDLLLAMLADDPQSRPTCREVLRHPFMTQSLCVGNSVALRQPPLDDLIKRRIVQLASLRHFRGLAFAMMAVRQEGQDLVDFTQQLTARRKALHRDLLVRAKTRQSLDLLHKTQLEQRPQQNDSSTSWRQRLHPLRGLFIPPQKLSAGVVGVQGAASACPIGQQLSTDSACSQQPLLHQNQETVALDQRPSFILTADSTGDASNHQQRQLLNPDLQLDSSYRSMDSQDSSSSSRQSLVSGEGGVESGLPSGGDISAAAAAAAVSCTNGAPLPNVLPHQRTVNAHALHRHSGLDTVAEPPEEDGRTDESDIATTTATRLLLRSPDAKAMPLTSGGGYGWSSSGRQVLQEPTAAQRTRHYSPHGNLAGSLEHAARDLQMDLATVDPLALIRELPEAVMGTLGRAHTAPESLAASLLPLQTSDGVGGSRGGAGAGVVIARGAAGGGGGDSAAVFMQRIALGADMRAFSANSWTLDLLENADLLAALTGVPLDHQLSSNSDTSGHEGVALYGGGLVAMLSAARCSGVPSTLQRLRSDASRHGALANIASQDTSSLHKTAWAGLTGTAASTASRARKEGALPETVFVTATTQAVAAAAASVADIPTRSMVHLGSSDGEACTAAAAKPQGFLAAAGGDTGLLHDGFGSSRCSGQPRSLLPTSSAHPWQDGRPTWPQLPAVDAGADSFATDLERPLSLLHAIGRDDVNVHDMDDFKHTSLYLGTGSQHLGVWFPAAASQPAAAAASASVALFPTPARTTERASPFALASILTPAPESVVRRLSLAFVNFDDHITARTVEESVHGGRLWFGAPGRWTSGNGGDGVGDGIDSPVVIAVSDVSRRSRSSIHSVNWEGDMQRPMSDHVYFPSGAPIAAVERSSPALGLGEVPKGVQQEHRTLGQVAVRSMSSSRAFSPPVLARITECSDSGETSTREEAGNSAFAGNSSATAIARTAARIPLNKVAARVLDVSSPLLPHKAPSPRSEDGERLAARLQVVGSGSNGGGGSSSGGDGAPTPTQEGRWHSPFEALAATPLADPGITQEGTPSVVS